VSQSSSATDKLRRGSDRLTRGLLSTASAAAALLEEGDRRHAGVPEDARDLLTGEIAPDPSQPRRHFDESDLSALADDIGRRGILNAILVRPPQTPGGPYRLVCGERRWRAAQLAGLVRLPARVRDLSDEEVRAAQLAENVLRAGLSDIEKGRSLRALYDLRKAASPRTTWEDVASEVGLGRARIHDLFQLAGLPESVAGLIESGRLSGSHGIALQRAQGQLGLDTVVQLAQDSARPEGRRSGGYGLSVAELRERIQQLVSSDTAPAAPAPALRPFLRRTMEALGQGKLSEQERALLRRALDEAPPPGKGARRAKETRVRQ
jgi:ParB family chromosome partitioning protein